MSPDTPLPPHGPRIEAAAIALYAFNNSIAWKSAQEQREAWHTRLNHSARQGYRNRAAAVARALAVYDATQ